MENELHKFKNLSQFKYEVEDYFGSELTVLSSADTEDVTLKKTTMMQEGIGCVLQVKSPANKTFLAVLEDFDFDTDKNDKRYIFRYYDTVEEEIIIIDTLYDKGYEITKGALR